jgi:hypothetical protein
VLAELNFIRMEFVNKRNEKRKRKKEPVKKGQPGCPWPKINMSSGFKRDLC